MTVRCYLWCSLIVYNAFMYTIQTVFGEFCIHRVARNDQIGVYSLIYNGITNYVTQVTFHCAN